MDILKESIQYIKGVGPKRANLLNNIQIHTVKDLLYYFPRDYEMRKNLVSLNKINKSGKYLIKVIIKSNMEENKVRKGLKVYKCIGEDPTGKIRISFFNSPFLKNIFHKDREVYLYGEVKKSFSGLEITHPEYKFNEAEYTNHIMPIYNLTRGLNQNDLTKLTYKVIQEHINCVDEYIPECIRKEYRICDIKYALKNIHFPESIEKMKISKYRLVFEELLLLQLALFMVKNQISQGKGVVFKHEKQVDNFIDSLPFSLTKAQKNVVEEIKKDLESDKPMNRLVQGDVGSGKTVVALISLLEAVFNGYQGALMAPTEILAQQHYEGCIKLYEGLNVKVELLTGSTRPKNKERILDDLKKGNVDIVIGTHSLIQDKVEFKNLALVITDEQHRFGVNQRNVFAKKGINPNILVMTATPIPRTLALILYGDLDVSIIDELPPGRKEIKTYGSVEKDKAKVYEFIKKEIQKGRQAYVVAPLVEESETLDMNSATEIYDSIKEDYFKDYNVGLVHGKMKNKDKEEVMNKFKNGETHVLVATTVIEVGVNVPNASIMVIENSERFGLAQLHQLRGRVGRGEYQSYCILINNGKSPVARERVEIMTKTNDGFIIAEEDLKIRGPGEFFGTIQHGIPQLKMANLFRHMKILKLVQKKAEMIVKEDSFLESKKYEGLKKKITNEFGKFIENISL
ncbi:MAG: ATP-dependent DNA helicase RecG [Anaeromicrobium sp.]|jgi:ATP-dependent DNA helicase RecG|uniref:ATP-dependent DNA helicase RecG n=1 Tax=Anaeromicrobium sp. TaxID=1929132 RepID=UPI0025D8222C|nr:ATP-dependent DNA helicase RecG [Anaeromicrobium sp.]MCT4594889.1 ATP-dependent DNA helicase RecG [Anaeromicrobium sp.]